jgi:myosin heavy subunit
MGVLDTIKIRKDGYPVRRLYRQFCEKYELLDPGYDKCDFKKHCELGTDFKELALKICRANVPHLLGKTMILEGNTKMFLKLDAATELDKKLLEIMKKR